MTARRDPKLVGRWFIVREEGGAWDFVDKDVWDRTGAPIRGEREADGTMRIEDSIINMTRSYIVSDRQLLEQGYIIPGWVCANCANSALLRPRFCPECGTATAPAGTE